MTEQLREKIANYFLSAINAGINFEARDKRGISLEVANQILKAFKDAGGVLEVKDAELPRLELHTNDDELAEWLETFKSNVEVIYSMGVSNMLNAGYRQVEEIEI